MFVNLRPFGLAALSVLAAASSVFAQTNTANPITNPTAGTVITAGQSFTITWTPSTNGSVQLQLVNGPAANVNYVAVITASTPNTGSFVWNVPANTPAGTDYAIAIKGAGPNDLNFSPRFTISSTVTTTASAASTASGSATASASASVSKSASASAASTSAASAAATSKASGSSTLAPPPTSGAESINVKFASVFMVAGTIFAGFFAI